MEENQVISFMHTVNPLGYWIEKGMLDSNKPLFARLFQLAEQIAPVTAHKHRSDRFVWIRSIQTENEEKQEIWHGLYLVDQGEKRALFLDRVLLVESVDHSEEQVDMSPFLEWLISEVERCIAMLRSDDYNACVRKNLPYEHRAGFVKRKVFWDYVPGYKKRIFGEMTDVEKQEFVTWQNTHRNKAGYGCGSMTSGKYFEACDFLYDLFGKENPNGQTPKERYKRYADGRDSGLLELDEASPEEFGGWLAQGFFDHAWEFYFAKRMDLRIVRVEGEYFFEFFYSELDQEIHYIMELVKHGYPVYAQSYDRLVRKIMGEDLIAICPCGCDWAYYTRNDKEQVRTADDRLLPTDCPQELINAIYWYDIPAVYLN